MQASTKPLVVFGVVTSLWLIGCSSKPAGSQPNTRTGSPTESTSVIVTPVDSTEASSATTAVRTGTNPDEKGASKTTPPIIGQLKSRHHTILIHTGSDGPRFTVATLDGKVIAEALSVDEMQAQHPEIYETYKSSFAKYDGYLDASSPLHTKLPPFGGAPAGR
jgi:hypothetical protein